jgi:hypothetical protein
MHDQPSTSTPTRGRQRATVPTLPNSHGIQLSNSTRVNRYPHVFQAVSELSRFAGLIAPRLLSYGCSTGEEVDTLSRLYFIDSEVLGVDVAEEALAQARAGFGSNPRLRFEPSDKEFLAKQPKFAIIFAMSVLCRWPETRNMTNLSELFPFAAFESQVEFLDSLLDPGGFLVVFNASYSFLQTAVSSQYDLVLHPRIRNSGFVRQFNRDGTYSDGKTPSDCIYRKKSKGEAANLKSLTILDARLHQLGCVNRDLALALR